MGHLNRHNIKRAEQAVKGDTLLLECPECGQQFRVAEDTDLDYLAWDWAESTGGEPHYQPTPPDVFLLTDHPHPVEALLDKRTDKPWLKWVEEAGGPLAQ